MRTAVIFALIALCGAYVCGCGSSTNGQRSFTVQVQDDRTEPKFLTVQDQDTVQWINNSGRPVQIVSGTLAAQGNPNIVRLVSITNTGFTPTNTVANLGDTIRFANNSFSAITLQIVNDANQIVSSITLPVGNQQDFPFPSAGIYTIRNAANPLFAGTVTLFGRPSPNNIFQSPVLPNGGVFTRQFTQTGSFNYFVREQNNPNESFITGTVSVQ